MKEREPCSCRSQAHTRSRVPDDAVPAGSPSNPLAVMRSNTLKIEWQSGRGSRSSMDVLEPWSLNNAWEESRLCIAGKFTGCREAEEKLRLQASLLDKSQDAILVLDPAHRVLYWNQSAERFYGWTAEEASQRLIEDLIHCDDSDFLVAAGKTLTQGAWLGELEQVTRTGKTLVVEGRWTLMRDGRGNAKSILVVNTDITARKKLERQVLRAQRMESIGTLAGGIAHDLNNLLTPIMMSVELLKIHDVERQFEEMLDLIGSSARRGADLVGQVLSFARGAEGRRIEVHLADLIQEVAKFATDTFPRSLRIETDLAPDLWPLRAEPTLLHQVILNLCVNARDAMLEGGRLRISAANVLVDELFAAMNHAASVGPHVCLRVEDDGIGMPNDMIDKIFEPFFTTKETGQGTGLGLATALGIVKSHHGFIRVESEPASGSRFSVYLPATDEISRDPVAPQEPELPKGHGETILVVDDEAPVRQITMRTLESFGYTVLTASDGAEALSLYAARPAGIDVVITDMSMPFMDGPTLIQVLRRLTPEIPVIGVSGVASNERVIRTMQAGTDRFLRKPYTSGTLLRTLREVLQDKKV